jgi:spore maturation protein SpmA
VLNWIWLALILGSVVYGGLTGRMQAVSDAVFESARGAVDLVIGLVGVMVFFLGLMRVARDGGLLRAVARGLAPLMRRLFPDVPTDHPAMGAMVMNFATNILGLGNAATPFGLKAMVELDRLNPRPGVATDAMAMFLAINASSITLMPPTGTIAIRAAAGSADPFAIWLPTLIATTCSTLAAVAAVYLLRARERARRARERALPEPTAEPAAARPERTAPAVDESLAAAGPAEPAGPIRRLVVAGVLVALGVGIALHAAELGIDAPAGEVAKELTRAWLFPMLIAALLLVGFAGRVPVYESMVAGAREGLEMAVRILPFLVAILVAVAMFRASGALDLLVGALDPLTSLVGFPGEALPMALLRPLSGSGAFGVMAEIVKTQGPDSFVGNLVCTLQGTTETTFYVLTLYFGAAGVRNMRYTLAACLVADVAGLAGATAACHLFFGG